MMGVTDRGARGEACCVGGMEHKDLRGGCVRDAQGWGRKGWSEVGLGGPQQGGRVGGVKGLMS